MIESSVRRLKPVRTSAPANRILSTAEAKAHLRVDNDAEDTLIDSYVLAAEQWLDGYTGVLGRALITQTWREDFSHFEYEMPLRLGPVQSITSVEYYDADNVLQTVSSSVYRLHETASRAYLRVNDNEAWPTTWYSRDDAVRITYVAGYGDNASDVPEGIRQIARLLVAHWEQNRSAVTVGSSGAEVPMSVANLANLYTRRW